MSPRSYFIAFGAAMLALVSPPADARPPHAASPRAVLERPVAHRGRAAHEWAHVWRRHTVAPSIIHVHDGDTFYTGGEAIRLRGIDTPDLGRPKSRRATNRLSALLRQGPVTIVPRAGDVYGRTVADVSVRGRDVAAELRREGFEKPDAGFRSSAW